jgi:hypothetical protein
LLDLNASQAGALAQHRDVPAGHLHLRRDGGGYCLHEPLRRHDGRAAALERWIRSVGDTYGEVLAGDDAVHYDFQPANLLAPAARQVRWAWKKQVVGPVACGYSSFITARKKGGPEGGGQGRRPAR